ncbi:TonB-dependent receptor domain-containing protein [Jejudonia soesokkakensis]|uniref:TonB-dependent receptor domain-containing protein n=1 Tax=Jejudonia soesokkakensis TaxID=1323432 RepID=A0ABW2MRH3_9FLAO
MKTYILVFLFVCAITGTTAQNIISGTITSATDSQPIVANIYFPQLEKGTISSVDGNFRITNIPDGTFTIVYSALGFASFSERINFSENASVEKNIILSESAVEMEEVIVSTPFHKLQRDNVMKVERISTDDLSKQGTVTLAEGITNIAGVSSISTGVGIGKPVIRGLSANRVLTYTQGVRLENQQFGDEHGLGVNEAGIESVEVIKGPASLLYGSDALGGVLYLNPENFAPENSVEGDVNSSYYSNTLGFSNNVGARASSENWKFLTRAAYVTHSDYETGEGENVTNSRFNEFDLKAGTRFQTEKLKSTLRYNYNRSNIGIPEEIGEQSNNKQPLFPFQEIDNHVISWENNFYFTNSSLDIKTGYTINTRKEFELEEEEERPAIALLNDEGIPPALEMRLKTLSYDVKYNLPQIGNFETIVGIQGIYQTNENSGEEILIPDATTTDFGILATTHYHLETLDIQAGIRYDIRSIESDEARDPMDSEFIPALDRNFNSFNAAFGVKKDLTKALVARVNLASGFRAPNLAELTSNGVHEGTNRYEIGNPDLENEQNFQADVSLEFRNEHFELFANGFYNSISNYIFITPNGEIIDDNNVFDYVQDDARLYGGELGLHIHPHPLDWLHIESSFENVRGTLKADDSNLPLIPANTLRNTLRVEFNQYKRLKDIYSFIGLESTFQQNDNSPFETPTDGYSLLSAGVGGTFDFEKTALTLRVSGNNLTDKTYVSHLSRLKQDGIPNIGRNIVLNARVAF